jgi:hypothetical protein
MMVAMDAETHNYLQAEGFGAAIPASWCLSCGSLVLDKFQDRHDESLHAG